MRLLLPKQPAFFQQFKELNITIKEITQLLSEFAVTFKDFEGFFVRAKEIEHKGDEITHRIIENLNKTFITPFDREDIYNLAQRMDDVIDVIDRTIQNIYIYQVTAKKPGVDEFVTLAVKATSCFDELIAECFEKQRHTPTANNWIVKIHELEDDADLLFQKYIRQLFLEEADPVTVLKWKDIYNNLEEIMDKFQLVSDALESMIVKFS